MPIYMGCVDPKISVAEDIFWPMEWGVKENSLFGVLNPPSPQEIYKLQHNDSVGEIWKSHHIEFAKFLSTEIQHGKILEIGSATGKLNNLFYSLHKGPDVIWDTIEPNPVGHENLIGGGRHIDGWFPEDCAETDYDAIVHSHVIEHVENPIEFLKEMNQKLRIDGKLIFSWPNMRAMLLNSDLNILMFEHLNYLSFNEMISLLEYTGFKLKKDLNYSSHSIFIAATKVRESDTRQQYQSKVTNEELKLFGKNYGEGLSKIISNFNETLKNSKSRNYIFGAHIFSQYLFANGLNLDLISGCFDNSDKKHNKRLYGWEISVHKPEREILSRKEPMTILLPMGSYEGEIIRQLEPNLHPGSLIHGIRSGILRF